METPIGKGRRRVRENRYLEWRTLPIHGHHPDLDEDISVANLLAGRPSEESRASLFGVALFCRPVGAETGKPRATPWGSFVATVASAKIRGQGIREIPRPRYSSLAFFSFAVLPRPSIAATALVKKASKAGDSKSAAEWAVMVISCIGLAFVVTLIRGASLSTGVGLSWKATRSSAFSSVPDLNVLRGTKKRRVTTHSPEVVAWKKGKLFFFCPSVQSIRTTPRSDQSVGAKQPAPSFSTRSTMSSRIRPSQRAGRPLRATRSRVCHLRPSISQGAWAEAEDSAAGSAWRLPFLASFSPVLGWTLSLLDFAASSALWAAAFGSNSGRSAKGPVASRPWRNLAVWLRGFRATSSGGPSATSSPPPAPASGPRSRTQSAVLITSRLCSMTTTVLPRSARR